MSKKNVLGKRYIQRGKQIKLENEKRKERQKEELEKRQKKTKKEVREKLKFNFNQLFREPTNLNEHFYKIHGETYKSIRMLFEWLIGARAVFIQDIGAYNKERMQYVNMIRGQKLKGKRAQRFKNKTDENLKAIQVLDHDITKADETTRRIIRIYIKAIKRYCELDSKKELLKDLERFVFIPETKKEEK